MHSSAPTVTATASGSLRAYVALTKPRIIELLLVTTVPAMFLAAGGVPEWQKVVWTLVGGDECIPVVSSSLGSRAV